MYRSSRCGDVEGVSGGTASGRDASVIDNPRNLSSLSPWPRTFSLAWVSELDSLDVVSSDLLCRQPAIIILAGSAGELSYLNLMQHGSQFRGTTRTTRSLWHRQGLDGIS